MSIAKNLTALHTSSMGRFLSDRWFAVLVLTAFLLFSISAFSPFIYDDFTLIPLNRAIRDYSTFSNLIFQSPYPQRFFMTLFYRLAWVVSGGKTWSFHFLNIFIHLLNGFLLMRLIRRILPKAEVILFVTLTLFLLHPLQTQAVSYIKGLVDLLEVTCFLAALLLCSETTASSRWKLCLLLFLAPWVRETCLLIPLSLIAWHLTVGGETLQTFRWKERTYYLIPLLISGPLLLLASKSHGQAVGFQLFPMGDYLLAQLSYLAYDFYLLLNPTAQSLIHEYAGRTSLDSLSSLLKISAGLIPLVSMLIIAFTPFCKQRRDPSLSFFLSFILLGYACKNTFLQFTNPFAEYRLYFLNISVFFAAAWLAEKLLKKVKRPILQFTLASFFFITLASLNFVQQLLWADPFKLVNASLENYPQSRQLTQIKAGLFEKQGDSILAEKLFQKAIQLNELEIRKTLEPKILLIQLYAHSGQWEKALSELSSLPIANLTEKQKPLTYFQLSLFVLSHAGPNHEAEYSRVFHEGSQFYQSNELTEPPFH